MCSNDYDVTTQDQCCVLCIIGNLEIGIIWSFQHSFLKNLWIAWESFCYWEYPSNVMPDSVRKHLSVWLGTISMFLGGRNKRMTICSQTLTIYFIAFWVRGDKLMVQIRCDWPDVQFCCLNHLTFNKATSSSSLKSVVYLCHIHVRDGPHNWKWAWDCKRTRPRAGSK
jgi:hypothetical protein